MSLNLVIFNKKCHGSRGNGEHLRAALGLAYCTIFLLGNEFSSTRYFEHILILIHFT